MLDQGAVIVGPLLAGLLIAVSNPSVAIAADAASFAVLAVTAWVSVRGTGVEPTATGAAAPERAQGFRFIAGNPALLGLLVLSCLFFLFYGPVEVALPLYVLGTLHGSAGLLAVFWAVFGTGAVISGITIGLLRRLPLWPTALSEVIGWGAALLPLGLLHTAHRRWPASPSAVCSTPPTSRCPTPCFKARVHLTCCPRSLPPAVRSPSSPLPSATPSATPRRGHRRPSDAARLRRSDHCPWPLCHHHPARRETTPTPGGPSREKRQLRAAGRTDRPRRGAVTTAAERLALLSCRTQLSRRRGRVGISV